MECIEIIVQKSFVVCIEDVFLRQKPTIMKKIISTLFICAAAVCSAYANSLNDSIAQPTHIILTRHNASGEVLSSSYADFGYYDEGKLKTFNYAYDNPGKTYSYDGDFLKKIRIKHGTEHPV